MSTRRYIEALACAAILAATPLAHAAGSEAEFKLHYDRGLSLYTNEQYDDAIREFQRAYDAIPRPRVLFNLGQAHRNLGNARQALDYYLLYQAREPNPKPGLKSELEAYIAQMRRLLAEADAADKREEPPRPATPQPAMAPPAPPPPSPTSAPPNLQTSAPLDPYADVTATPSPKPPVYKRAWLWCVVGAVVTAAVITGVTVGTLQASSSSPNGPVARPFGLGVF